MWGIFVNYIWGAYLETLAAPKSIKKNRIPESTATTWHFYRIESRWNASNLCRCPSPTWREFHQGNAGDDLFSHLRSRFSKRPKKNGGSMMNFGPSMFSVDFVGSSWENSSQIPKQPLVAMGYNDNWVQKPHPRLFKHVHPWVHHWKTNDERW